MNTIRFKNKRSFVVLIALAVCLTVAIPMGFPTFKPEAPEFFQGLTWFLLIFAIFEQAHNTEITYISASDKALIVKTKFLFINDVVVYPEGTFESVSSISFAKRRGGGWHNAVVLKKHNGIREIKLVTYPSILEGSAFSPSVLENPLAKYLRENIAEALSIHDEGFLGKMKL